MGAEPDIGLIEKVKNKIENFNFCKTTHLGFFHGLLIHKYTDSFIIVYADSIYYCYRQWWLICHIL